MIDVAAVLEAVPGFETFCSVAKLSALVETLRADSARFDIQVCGTSADGVPIHHVRYGKGSVKALVVGFPHCNEVTGGLTVFSLLTLLKQAKRELIEADVEWHIVPCIDPDGAMLNEGWSQRPFTLESHMRHYHRQEPCDQVERSFPIEYQRLVFDRPIPEAQVLQGLLTQIRPDFFFSLHNALAGAAHFALTRDIGQNYYRSLHELLQQHGLPLRASSSYGGCFAQFGEGVAEIFTARKYYDCLERMTPLPEEGLHGAGAASFDCLMEVNPQALAFVAELPYVKHPSDGSQRETAQNLRQFKLRMDADAKFLATVIVEEWDKVEGDLQRASPFYRKISSGVIAARDKLHEGLPSWEIGTREVLFNPAYGKTMTEGERLAVCMHRFYALCNGHEFVRLLNVSTQTAGVRQATRRMERVIDEAWEDIGRTIELDRFEVIDCDALARVQLGSGLIALNSVLQTRVSG